MVEPVTFVPPVAFVYQPSKVCPVRVGVGKEPYSASRSTRISSDAVFGFGYYRRLAIVWCTKRECHIIGREVIAVQC